MRNIKSLHTHKLFFSLITGKTKSKLVFEVDHKKYSHKKKRTTPGKILLPSIRLGIYSKIIF